MIVTKLEICYLFNNYYSIFPEPQIVKKQQEEEMAVDPSDLMPEPSGFVAFKGAGNRLDGKKRKDSTSAGKTFLHA